MSLKDKLLRQKLRTADIELLGDKVKLRQLSGTERLEFGRLASEDIPEDIKRRYRFIWLASCPIKLTEEEFGQVFDADFDSVYAVFIKVLELSHMLEDDAKELEKNLESAEKSGSGTESPRGSTDQT